MLMTLALLAPRYEATASLVVTDPRATTLFSATEAAALDAERYVADQKAIMGSDIIAGRAAAAAIASQPEAVMAHSRPWLHLWLYSTALTPRKTSPRMIVPRR